MPSVLIPMADYGHDPTEVAIPYSVFKAAGFTVDFATETGKTPECDRKMLKGITGTLLGADAKAKAAYADMAATSASFKSPKAWTDPAFSLDEYDLVMLPGGHDKGVRQVIDSKAIHDHLARFFPGTSRSTDGAKKTVAAICHGVQILALETAKIDTDLSASYKSIIHACATTALPSFMETSIYNTTRLFLGDYYKTYGACTPNVEDYVKCGLDNPEKQFSAGPGMLGGKMNEPFIVEDEGFRYVSGRFPPDAERLAERLQGLRKHVLS
ncbi:class I glutamine amidotransferase-like protein [Coniophora puteana RWD-64-598 SS2]|uniref:Class I glutamine amidotransferase-like protein n=1 Tax=Coniophora puteana (strain RWD-64-598) TaxID=741705 RepID=A0A5M3MB21_CONPW|nr:class I glutamine amidotransferase-like protein [Coniophora puteana RWD-64-598 SS2]EIW76429.1 class I glutamine amidotransferase-like protein [Coniophora puteana RWD-64-598 SS2]